MLTIALLRFAEAGEAAAGEVKEPSNPVIPDFPISCPRPTMSPVFTPIPLKCPYTVNTPIP